MAAATKGSDEFPHVPNDRQGPTQTIASLHPLTSLPPATPPHLLPDHSHSPAGCFTGPHDAHHLATLQPVVARHRVAVLYARQLVLLDLVPLQQRCLLLWRQDPVLRHQLVLGDVDQQLWLREALNNQLATDLSNHTPT